MADSEQPALPFDPKQMRRLKLRRGIYLLPSLFTVANLLCGYYAVMATLAGGANEYDRAAKAIGYAILFDSLDGRVARLTGTNTEFGKQLDSLADVVSFGIAPAVLALAWGVKGLADPGFISVQQISQMGWLCCLIFLICCAWRLARFNVQGMAPGGLAHFVGMPTPAAAGVIAGVIHAFKQPLHDWRWAVAWLLLAAGLGALMTSTVRYYSFKDIAWTRRYPSLGIVLIALIVAGIYLYSEIALFLIATGYAAAGVIIHLVRWLRLRAAQPAV
jgi:CDP-diacylglycerol--serine O-phosphatidyltransferase